MHGNPPEGTAAASSSIATVVDSLMPQLEAELAELVAIPSVSAPGFPEPRQPLRDAHEAILGAAPGRRRRAARLA